MTADYEPLWHWVREREYARERKEAGDPFPWAKDPIISAWRFCNVRREDDRVTRWVREEVRERYPDHPLLWFMLCLCRMINWPDTLQELQNLEVWPGDPGFAPDVLASVLHDRAARGDKVFTGAYIIPTVAGLLKTESVAKVHLGALWSGRDRFAQFYHSAAIQPLGLRQVHGWLIRHDGWGPFLAYQAVVDMRFTRLLDHAPDAQRWAAAGPGTLRGLNRVYGRALDRPVSQDQALMEMREIHARSFGETGVKMDFSDVPNILCETDKYLRVKLGQGTPRARYVPGRGS